MGAMAIIRNLASDRHIHAKGARRLGETEDVEVEFALSLRLTPLPAHI